MKTLLAIALVLLIPSLYTIALMTREWTVGQSINSRLHVEGEYFNLSPSWKGHTISLTDDALPTDSSSRVVLAWGYVERPGRVTLRIDGRDFSCPHDVGIRPESNGILNRYHHWIYLGLFRDNGTRDEEFLIVQRYIDHGENWYRVLRLSAEGKISEEVFPHSARTDPIERTFFVRLVYPNGIGFYSDVLQVWPSIFYPVAYPAGTAMLGLILLCATTGWWGMRRKKTKQAGIDNFGADQKFQPKVMPRFLKILGMTIVGSLALLAVLFALFFFWNRGDNERIIIPKGYRGYVGIFYEQPKARMLKKEGKWLVLDFPSSGTIFTSARLNTGWHKTEFFERDDQHLVPIRSTLNGPMSATIPTDERIVSGGAAHTGNGISTVIVYHVGNAEDRAKLDWRSTDQWIQAAFQAKK